MKKSVIKKAIKFFESLKEGDFCRYTQKEGDEYCAYGHMFLNPKSPFFVKEWRGKSNTDSFNQNFINDETRQISEVIDCHLANVNNDAPIGEIRQSCINWLEGQVWKRFNN